MKPVSMAVVGLGKFGRLHARTLAQLAEAELVGLVDTQPVALDAICNELPDVPTWNCLETALKECHAEGWVVASSTASHVPVARALLEEGRNVLVEKPLAENLSDAESLASFVAPDSGNLMLGHVLLFSSEFRQLLIEAQRRGPIVYIDGVRHRPIETLRNYPGASLLRLTMVHDLYCVLALMNRAEPSRFSIQLHRTNDGASDLAVVLLQWENGAVATLTASFLAPAGLSADGFDRMEVFGQGWAARIEPNPRPFTLWEDHARWPMGLEIRTDAESASGMLAEELRCFCRVVRGEQKVPRGATYNDALQVERWLDRLEAVSQTGAYESHRSC